MLNSSRIIASFIIYIGAYHKIFQASSKSGAIRNFLTVLDEMLISGQSIFQLAACLSENCIAPV
jgi:hypothetical protein